MLLTTADVAAELQCSPETVRGLLRGGLPHVRIGRMLRVRREDLDRWLEGRVYRDGHVAQGESERRMTCAHARDVLKRSLADAVRDGHVERNVAALARPPRQERGQIAAPTTATVRALLVALEGHRLHDMILVMAATGIRVGEAMGLRWQDVIISPLLVEALTVRYQLARVDGEPVLAEPKSARSRRTILLPPVAAVALRSQKARQAAEQLAAGDKWQDATGLVFLTAQGRPLSESTVQWVLSQACKAAGLPHVSPHGLRRYAATIAASTGDMKAAQGLLGHTASAMTADLYASATDASRRRAADAAQDALG